MKPIAGDWRVRIETAALRYSAEVRTILLQRLVDWHEQSRDLSPEWLAEIERRLAEYEAGQAKTRGAAEVLADMRERRKDRGVLRCPAGPVTMDEIEDQATYLPNPDFAILLTNLEAGLPEDTNTMWRANIRQRIQSIHAAYEEQERGWEEFSRLHPELDGVSRE